MGAVKVWDGSAWVVVGRPGASAYEVAVAEGFAGDEAAWLASLVGATGAAGADGADSTVPGPAGATGPTGADGPAGASGAAGADGADLVANLFHNPAMEVWQRGTASVSCTAAARTFLADRWFVRPEGAAVTQEQSTTVPTGSGARYSVKITGAASVTTVDFAQRIEAANVPPLARTVTISWRVYNATGASLTPSLLIGTPGTADDFTTVTNRLTQALQACADAAWTTVSHTVDISAYTNLANGIEAVLRFPSGSVVAGDYVLVTEAQATATAAAVEFTRPGAQAELATCQRYAWSMRKQDTYSTFAPGWAISASVVRGFLNLPVPMRIFPTLTSSPGSGGDFFLSQFTGIARSGVSLSLLAGEGTLPPVSQVVVVSSGGTGGITFATPYGFSFNGGTGGYLLLEAELT